MVAVVTSIKSPTRDGSTVPTIHHRSGDTRLHPRQTDYYIIAHPPDIGYITYQIHGRARDFLVEVLGYGDEDELSWSLVHPLRQVGDLFTVDEGGPGQADPTESDKVTTPQITEQEIEKLATYFESHPDIVGDLSQFRIFLRDGNSNYMDAVTRDGYTPMTTPGHAGGTGNNSLDRIANQYFGDGPETIEWKGERVSDFVTREDRNGQIYRFPEIRNRLPEGEEYRLSKDLYERWGAEIGASNVNSRRYEPGESGFPNYWIGQREESPEPSLEDALSPRAFFYRTLAGRSGRAPGVRAKEAFEEACDYSLEVYKANFPEAVDPQTLSNAYTTVEKATKPWEDFQVPPAWELQYIENDGLPPLKS